MNFTQSDIDKVFNILITQYNYDRDVLYSTLDSISHQQSSPTHPPPPSTSSTPSQEEKTKCKYVFKRGARANKECGNTATIQNSTVCNAHIKFKDKISQQQPKIIKKYKKCKNAVKNSTVYNNCTNDEEECYNLDEMDVPSINKLYLELFKTSHIDLSAVSSTVDKYNLLSEEIFLEKKKAIVNHCIEHDIKIKATLTKLGQLEFDPDCLITTRHPKGTILKLVKYKLSKHWIDYSTKLIFKSPHDLIVVGRINRYEQPLLSIDGTAFDLILKYQFEYDESLLNENGKQAKESFDISCARYKQIKEAQKMLAEPSIIDDDDIIL
jgi:hypothetical protein